MTSKIGPAERDRVRKFHLKEKANEENLIPHKNCVKYLGVNIDEKLNYKQLTSKSNSPKPAKLFGIQKGCFIPDISIAK